MTPATLAERIGFTEGPLLRPRATLLVTGCRAACATAAARRRPDEDRGRDRRRPNGLAAGRRASTWRRTATRRCRAARSARSPPASSRSRDGAVEDLVTTGCLAPNDLVVGPDGLVWFTDPDAEAPGVRRSTRSPGRCSPAGRDRLPERDGVRGLRRAPVRRDSAPTRSSATSCAARLHAPTLHAHVRGGPDGIAFDPDGHMYVAAFEEDEVAVLGSDGTSRATIPTGAGSRPTNLCFAGRARHAGGHRWPGRPRRGARRRGSRTRRRPGSGERSRSPRRRLAQTGLPARVSAAVERTPRAPQRSS